MGGFRESQLGMAIGRKGVGKTFASLKEIQNILKGNAKTGAKPRKVLILDVNNEYGDVRKDHKRPDFAHIRAIALQDVKRFTYSPIIEARRVTTQKPDGGIMTLKEISESLSHILANFQNGLLLIEDPTKFLSDSLPGDLIGAICTQRHKSIDIILHFQSVGKMAQPKLWANVNWLRVHRTEDTVAKHANKFGSDVTHLYLAEKLVEIQAMNNNPRFYVFVDKEMQTIHGAFTKADFQKAVELYLIDNYNSIVKKEVSKRNIRTGELIHPSQEVAVNKLVQEYINLYYGNPK